MTPEAKAELVKATRTEHEARLLRTAGAKTPNGFLLHDTVRRDCPICGGTMIRNAALVPDIFDGRLCSNCQGRGWIPSTDSMDWAAALWLWILKHLSGDELESYVYDWARGDFFWAIATAERALIAAGVLKVESDLGTT